MAIQWNFDNSQYKEHTFEIIPVGEHRVRIAAAEEAISVNNNPMIKLTLDVSGYNSTILHNVMFLADKQELTNQKLGELFNSFGIQTGNLNIATWIGKTGAAKVKHEPYNGEDRARVAYFINRDRQDKLPAWVEPSNKAAVTGQATPSAPTPVPTPSDLPWA